MSDELTPEQSADDSRRSYDVAIAALREANETLKAPFPWFGGKSKVAHIVWERLGKVDNYVEPFFGSGAVLLMRPHAPKVETVNDLDGMIANFWRAVQADPEAVARHADWPVNETDLAARHYWLVTDGARRLEAILGDPGGYDAQVAGWWVWGLCSWIGGGWCSGSGPWRWDGAWVTDGSAGQGISRRLPHLGRGQGINRQRPHLGNAGQGIQMMMQALARRLRGVRVCHGDWSRVTGPSVTHGNGLTGVFLDPPYADTAGRTADLYAKDSLSVAHDVREWAVDAGRNPLMRICLAGYDGEHVMPADWQAVRWKAHGGMANQSEDGAGRENAKRETLWFSPHCLLGRQSSLLDLLEAS